MNWQQGQSFLPQYPSQQGNWFQQGSSLPTTPAGPNATPRPPSPVLPVTASLPNAALPPRTVTVQAEIHPAPHISPPRQPDKAPPAKKRRVQTPAKTISATPEVLSPPTQEAESTAGDPPSHSEASSDILEDPLLSIEQEEFTDPSESKEDRELKLYRQRIKLLREMKDLPIEEKSPLRTLLQLCQLTQSHVRRNMIYHLQMAS